MTQAASQASAFYEEVASSRRVFTVLDSGSFLVFRVREIEVVPFWSSQARVQRVQRNHAKYRAFECDESDLERFLGTTLPDLENEAVHVGVNWSGRKLTGYDVAVADLRNNLAYWLDKLAR